MESTLGETLLCVLIIQLKARPGPITKGVTLMTPAGNRTRHPGNCSALQTERRKWLPRASMVTSSLFYVSVIANIG